MRSALVLSDSNQIKVKAWIAEGKVDPLFMDLFKESEFAQSPLSMSEVIDDSIDIAKQDLEKSKTINKDGLI